MEGKGRFLSIACVLAVSLFLTNNLTAPPHDQNTTGISDIPDPGYLSVWSVTENYDINRRLLASLYREHRDIWVASNDRHKALLERFNTPCMLLSTGRYLMDEETASNDLSLIRSVTHEDGEILMQEWMRHYPEGYESLKKKVLTDTDIMGVYSALQEDMVPDENPHLVFNHMMAKAFELRIITEKHVASRNELSSEELAFLEVMIPVTESREDDGSKYFPDFFLDPAERISLVRELQKDSSKRYERTAWWLGSIFQNEDKKLLKQLSPWINPSQQKHLQEHLTPLTSTEKLDIITKFTELATRLSKDNIPPGETIKQGIPVLALYGLRKEKKESFFDRFYETLGEDKPSPGTYAPSEEREKFYDLSYILAEQGFDPAYFMKCAAPEIHKHIIRSHRPLKNYLDVAIKIAKEGIDPTDTFAHGLPEGSASSLLESAFLQMAVILAKNGVDPAPILQHYFLKLPEPEMALGDFISSDDSISYKAVIERSNEEFSRFEKISAVVKKIANINLDTSGGEEIKQARIDAFLELKRLLEKHDLTFTAALALLSSRLSGEEMAENTIRLWGDFKRACKLSKMMSEGFGVAIQDLTRNAMILHPGQSPRASLMLLLQERAGVSQSEASTMSDGEILRRLEGLVPRFTRNEKELRERNENMEKQEKYREELSAAIISNIDGSNFREGSETANRTTNFLFSVAMDKLENTPLVRQAAVTALKTMPQAEAQTLIKQAMEDPDVAQKEIRIKNNANERSVATQIIEAISWVVGEKFVEENFENLNNNIHFMFRQNPGIMEFLKDHPLRIFSIRDKKKIDSITLADFRRYWFKVMGVIYFSSTIESEAYSETMRKVEIRHHDSPIDMGIAIETFTNKYLLASAIYHEYLHYTGIQAEGEVRLRQINFLKGIIAEDALQMSPEERQKLEKDLASVINKLGLHGLGVDMQKDPDPEKMAEYMEWFNRGIEKVYGEDWMTPGQIEAESSRIISDLERWIVLRNKALEEERKIDPSKKFYEPLDEEIKSTIINLIEKTRHIPNRLTSEQVGVVSWDYISTMKKWKRYLKDGGMKTFSKIMDDYGSRYGTITNLDMIPPQIRQMLIASHHLPDERALREALGSGKIVIRTKPAKNEAGGSGIGKFENIIITDIEEYTGGKVKINANIQPLGGGETQEIVLTGHLSPFGYLPPVKKTGMPVVDMIIEDAASRIKENKDARILILDQNAYGIAGVSAFFEKAPLLALESSIFGNPVANFHEMAHISNEWGILPADTILSFVTDPEIRSEHYTDKLQKYGYTEQTAPEGVKSHYALRALQRQQFGDQDAALTSSIKKGTSPTLIEAYAALEKKVRSSGLMAPAQDLNRIFPIRTKTTGLHFCVPADVLKNSADISLTLRRIATSRGKVPFNLVVTGGKGEDLDAIEALKDQNVREIIGMEGDLTIHSITEQDIQQRALLLDKNTSDPALRAGIVKDIYLETIGKMDLEEGEYMAIAIDHVTENEARSLEERLKKDLQDNISLRIPVSPTSDEGMFSLSDLLYGWLNTVHRGETSNISIVLPRVISPAEMARMITESMRTAWRLLIAA